MQPREEERAAHQLQRRRVVPEVVHALRQPRDPLQLEALHPLHVCRAAEQVHYTHVGVDLAQVGRRAIGRHQQAQRRLELAQRDLGRVDEAELGSQLGQLVFLEHLGEEQHGLVEESRVDGAPPLAVEHAPQLDERALVARDVERRDGEVGLLRRVARLQHAPHHRARAWPRLLRDVRRDIRVEDRQPRQVRLHARLGLAGELFLGVTKSHGIRDFGWASRPHCSRPWGPGRLKDSSACVAQPGTWRLPQAESRSRAEHLLQASPRKPWQLRHQLDGTVKRAAPQSLRPQSGAHPRWEERPPARPSRSRTP